MTSGERTLVAGWFSFPDTGATAGDLMAMEVVRGWLDEAGIDHDVALASRYGEGVDWASADPRRYSHLIFVCGPFFRSDLLRRFERSRLVGVDLSMVDPIEDWNPFDLLLERDSTQTSRPDLAIAAPERRVPVVGVCLLPPGAAEVAADEYLDAAAAARRLVERRDVAPIEIDTELATGALDLRTPAAVDSLIARVDVIVSTRLHGLVLGLRHGVPVLAIDPVPGGEKMRRQAEALGWSPVLGPDELDDASLDTALSRCLEPDARRKAAACADAARSAVAEIGATLVAAFADDPAGPSWGDGRRRGGWTLPDGPGLGGSRAGRWDRAVRAVRLRLTRGAG
jgi:hypothetical protein